MPDGLLGLTIHKSCGFTMMEIDGDGDLDHCYTKRCRTRHVPWCKDSTLSAIQKSLIIQPYTSRGQPYLHCFW